MVSFIDGAPNSNELCPSNMKASPTIAAFRTDRGGCVNNVGSPSNLGVAPGGGDADIAVTRPTLTTRIRTWPSQP